MMPLLAALGAGFVIIAARRAPLGPLRRIAVVLVRLLVMACVWLALEGWSLPISLPASLHVIYAVDQSASIDEAQRGWMARRISSLEALQPAASTRALVAFGAQAQVVEPARSQPLDDPAAVEQALSGASIDPEETNLDAALLTGLGTIPAGSRARIVLLTDGRASSDARHFLGRQPIGRRHSLAGEDRAGSVAGGDWAGSVGHSSSGQLESVLRYLDRFDVEVYPAAPPQTHPDGWQWDSLSVPPVVRQGASVPIRLAFANHTGAVQRAEVAVSLNGVMLARRTARLAPGWQVVSLSVPARSVGTMPLSVSVQGAAGERSEWQERQAFVTIEGPPKILVVTDRPTQLPPLAAALKRRDMEMNVSTPAELPDELSALLDYDAVILYHLPKSQFNEAQVGALREYLERFGGGLVMVGLGGRLDEELSQEAPLDALLPVRFEPKGVRESKRRVCMLMLIDRSASMMGPRIAVTKRAAVELVKQLAPEDLVGVLAFDTVPYVVAELQPARRVGNELVERLVRLKSSGGTDLLPALRAALERLSATDATVRHIILLSDGNTPYDSKAYHRMVEELTQQRISMSTIGIGSVFINTQLLEWLAGSTGGAYYQLNRLEDLPQLIVQDTNKTLADLPFSEGAFRVARGASAEWVVDEAEDSGSLQAVARADWPTLRGYFTATAKPTAVVELEIPRPVSAEPPPALNDDTDPLLARWPIGLGQAVVFTSDADARWSPEWVRWDGFEAVWARIMRRAMRKRLSEELFVWVDRQSATPQLIIEGQLDHPTAAGNPAPPDVSEGLHGALQPLSLIQTRPFRWQAPVAHLPSGWHEVVIRSGEGDASSFAKRWIQIGAEAALQETPHLAPDEPLLRRIAQATQGAYEQPDRALLYPTETIPAPRPLRRWLLPLALLLLLIDVALRGKTML